MLNIFFIVGLLTVPGLIGLVVYNLYFRKTFTHNKFIYIVALILVPFAFLMTYKFNYYMNENTRVYGFPVLCAIFQRDDVNSPWLDYVGWITYASIVFNYAFYLFWPMLFLTVHRSACSGKPQMPEGEVMAIEKNPLQLEE